MHRNPSSNGLDSNDKKTEFSRQSSMNVNKFKDIWLFVSQFSGCMPSDDGRVFFLLMLSFVDRLFCYACFDFLI